MIGRTAHILATLLAATLACTHGDEPVDTASSASSGSGITSTTNVETTSTTDTSSTSATSTPISTSTSTSTTRAETETETEATQSSSSTSAGDGLVSLKITPAQAQISIASGWSQPIAFSVVGIDAEGIEVPVDATWSIDDPGLGEITAKGGTLQARNTAAGVALVEVSADGQSMSAEVTIEQLGDHPSCADPRPPLIDGAPGPGLFTKVIAPEYAGTNVYHGVYLPPDWEPGRRYPVLVESPFNKYGTFTGRVDDATLGYYLAGCRSYIWIVVPYVSIGGQSNLDFGWGDVPATIAYWKLNVPRMLEALGGDPSAVIVSGFSRGAIGASYIGLHEPDIADLWLAFLMHSHADVPSNLTPDKGAGSAMRMERVWGRTTLLSWGAKGDGGAGNSLKGVDLLGSFGYPLSTLAVPGVGHTDLWMATDAESRSSAQDWLFDAVASRPGTQTIRGRVVDENNTGTAGALLRSGARATTTDTHGYYALRGLVPGLREVTCVHARQTCSPPQQADISDADGVVDFTVFAP